MGNNDIRSPFHSDDGELQFKLIPTNDLVFIWPVPPPLHYGKGLLEIPNQFREEYQDGEGIILAAGPGYWSRNDEGKDWFKAMSGSVYPGARVRYDGTIPWEMYVEGLDGEMHRVLYCTVGDVQAVVNN